METRLWEEMKNVGKSKYIGIRVCVRAHTHKHTSTDTYVKIYKHFFFPYCDRLNCVSPNSHIEVLTPRPVNVTLFGNRVFACKPRSLSNMLDVLLQKGHLATEMGVSAQEECPVEGE